MARVDRTPEMNGPAVQHDLAGIGNRRARERPYQRRLAGSVVADYREYLSGAQLEIHAVERRHVPVALHQRRGPHHDARWNRLWRRHLAPLRDSWSVATARITRTPVTRT